MTTSPGLSTSWSTNHGCTFWVILRKCTVDHGVVRQHSCDGAETSAERLLRGAPGLHCPLCSSIKRAASIFKDPTHPNMDCWYRTFFPISHETTVLDTTALYLMKRWINLNVVSAHPLLVLLLLLFLFSGTQGGQQIQNCIVQGDLPSSLCTCQ